MSLELLALVVSAWLGNADPAGKGPLGSWLPDVAFRPRERAVSNWRSEAAIHLETSGGTALAILFGRDPAQVTRCVRLNNYWCIKRAGWAGEIAADTEGHVAFASAAEGADVAALLLRRYYVDYGRHSALAIVSHWAPSSCGFAPPPARASGHRRSSSGAATKSSAADHLAVRGIGRTLRARFLASRGHRVTGHVSARLHRSAVPDRLIGWAMPAPAIAVGLGEAPISLGTQSLGSIPLAALGGPSSDRTLSERSARPAGPVLACADDHVRIQNYADKAAAGVATNAADDLHLFDAAGKPTPNLARLMHNMSAVEIGPLGASKALIAAAVDHAIAIATRQSRAASAATTAQAPTPVDR